MFPNGNRDADIGLQNALSRIIVDYRGKVLIGRISWNQAYRGGDLAVRGPAAQLHELFDGERSLRLRVSVERGEQDKIPIGARFTLGGL